MKTNYRVNAAILAILGAHATQAYCEEPPTPDSDDAASSGIALSEVTVTAQRRSENAQNVPITLQALTAETLTQLNVTTFDDFVRYLPNVTSSGLAPGQGDIYMRGLTFAQVGDSAGAIGSFPNVAVYLDEQSGQLPGRNLDVYAADLERVEVLEGPQGTLFGAGAQAGVIRYITNKPKLDVTEASVNGGYEVTAHGDPSTNVNLMVNLPIIENTLAVRAVIYNDARGGYIDNIPGTFSRSSSDRFIVSYFGGVVPPNSGSINNHSELGNAINTVVYKGARVGASWQINDDWNALVTQSYQNMDADGVFWEEEYDGGGTPLPPRSVQLYNPSYNKDKFEDTQLTVNGRIDVLKFIYAGGFLDRNINQQVDYTNYSRAGYVGYYQCNYPGYPFVGGKATTDSPGYCYSPSAYFDERIKTTHQSHEMRLSTPDDWRLRAIGGLFWENYTVHDESDWHFRTNPNFEQTVPPPGVTANNPNPRDQNESFFDDITRGYTQRAAFGSVDFDLIPKMLVLTVGSRYYSLNNFERGSNVGSFGCEINGPYSSGVLTGLCTVPQANGNDLNAKNLSKTYSGFKSRVNLSWHVTPDAMVYYTWSQGFRPGGFNRAQSVIAPTSPIYGQFAPPLAYGPDTLTNNEVGWKTEWFGHRLQWNGTFYQENWKNVQVEIFDPGVTGNLAFMTNGPEYRVRGAEMSLVARVARGLTVTASASENSSSVVKTINLVNTQTGQPLNIINPFGTIGSPLAQSPPFQGNIRIRYELPINGYDTFVQVGATHQAGSNNSTDALSTTLQGRSTIFHDPGFSTYDASLGVSKDAWSAQLYGQNLSNTLGIPYSAYGQWSKENVIIRPRTIGVRLSYKFDGNK